MLLNLLNQDNKEALETYCDILLTLRDMLAVSYTHLDVYKRQDNVDSPFG